jgi:hypothetical protein
MAGLIYLANTSLDSYIEDDSGAFDQFASDDDVFAFTTELLRSVGTFLFWATHVRNDGRVGDGRRPSRAV